MDDKLPLKILSYNLHGDRGFLSHRIVVKEIEQLLLEYDADVLCLQEIWRSTKESKDWLEHALKKAWPSFIFGENSYFPKYNQGNGVFTRFDIGLHKNYWSKANSKEQRGLIKTKLHLPNTKELYIYCTHLSTRYKESLPELYEFIKYIKVDDPDQYVLAGDFNDWQGRFSKILKEELGVEEVGIKAQGRHFKTFPAFLPLLPLDRIYYKGIDLDWVKRCKKIIGPSDHRSLLAQFYI